ncbi:hypothetical protein CBR_g777 [Chara braunii]|uniref:E3 UFM1-protein ligase 1 homolog n=1 Tax=Chara braunii TaxID=69332 RepID=A0A388KC88_CHABU|nr:hypothetical protein CBR_g777 [Chara braunii]|eukprot:GBG67649.1 hypothetical protein CBR_g777 [Chara braunii]
MDEELRLLQQRFLQAQEAQSTVRLSERNVVQLVLKLQQLGLLGADILHTINGREYLTQSHLRKEMEREIKKHGRVSLVDLAMTIGVDLAHCEHQAKFILHDNADTFGLVQGEIITTKYWDTVAEEIEETLQQSGQTSIAELARRFNMGAEVLTSVVASRLGSIINGKLEGGILYTPAYVARVKAMMRGAMRALTIPTPLMSGVWGRLEDLQEEMGIVGGARGGGSGIALMQSMVSSLVSEGAIFGTLRGGVASSWNPEVFLRSQKEAVEAFFSQNGFILYESLKMLAVPQPKRFMQAKYPDGVGLSTAYVHASVVSQLDAAADEAIQGKSWCDAVALLTPALSQADVAELLAMCPSVNRAKKEGRASLMAGTCVVTEDLVGDLIGRFEKVMMRQHVSQAERRTVTALGPASTNLPAFFGDNKRQGLASEGHRHSDEEEEGNHGVDSGKQRTLSGTNKKPSAHGGAEGSDDLRSSGKRGKGGGRKRSPTENGRKVGGGLPLPPAAAEGGAKAERREEVESDMMVPGETEIASKILEWYPEMELAGVGEGEEEEDGREGVLVHELAGRIRPTLMSTWLSLKKAAFSMSAEARKRRRIAVQQLMDDLYLNLQLYAKALDLFENDITISPVLHRHLLRVFAAEVADVLLHAQGQEHQISEGLISAADTSLAALPPVGQSLLSVQERYDLAYNLPADIRVKAIALVAAIDGKSVPTFMASLESLAEDCGVRLRKLDKKVERTLLHMHKRALISQLEAEQDPVAALPLAVSLLFAQVHARALQAPGRAIATVIASLKDAISKASHQMLMEYHSQTVFYLSFKNSQSAVRGSNDAEYWENQTEQKLKYIKDNMAGVKALALKASSSSVSAQPLPHASQHLNTCTSTSFMLSPSANAAAAAAAATAAASLRLSPSSAGSDGIAYAPASTRQPEEVLAQQSAGTCAQTHHRPLSALTPLSSLPPLSEAAAVNPDGGGDDRASDILVGERVQQLERTETQSTYCSLSNKCAQPNILGSVAPPSVSLQSTLTRALSESDSQSQGSGGSSRNGPTSPLLVPSVSPTIKGATRVQKAVSLGGSSSSASGSGWLSSSSSSENNKLQGHGFAHHGTPPRPPPAPWSATSSLARFLDVSVSSSSSNGSVPVPCGSLPKCITFTGDALASVDLTDEAMLMAPVKARAAVWDQRSLSWSAPTMPSSRTTSRSSSRASSRSSSPSPAAALSESQSLVGRASALLEARATAGRDGERSPPESTSPSSSPETNDTSSTSFASPDSSEAILLGATNGVNDGTAPGAQEEVHDNTAAAAPALGAADGAEMVSDEHHEVEP